LFFCSIKTDFEFLNMSIKDSKQMNLNILKEIFKHEYEHKQELKIEIRKVLSFMMFLQSAICF